MPRSHISFAAITLASAVAFAAVPAFAQNDQSGGNQPAASSSGSSAPSGTLTMSHGNWRSSELVGATVYNDDGKSIGTISDLLVSSDGQVSQAILSVGGFLGIGSKLVSEPFSKLKFVPSGNGHAQVTSGTGAGGGAGADNTAQGGTSAAGDASATGTNPAAGTDANANAPGKTTGDATAGAASNAGDSNSDYSVTLPGATVDSLKAQPAFTYNNQ
ncbi:PRC-barrel domain-containing protein [Acidisoma sp. 7E03]